MIGFVVRSSPFVPNLSGFLILKDPRMFVVTMVLVETDFGML